MAVPIHRRFALMSICSVCCGSWLFTKVLTEIHKEEPWFLVVLLPLLATSIVAIGIGLFVCLPLSVLPISRLHTVESAVKHFLQLCFLFVIGRRRWQAMELATKKPRKIQDAFLENILQENADTEYGRLRRFKSVTDRESYRKMVPLSDYESYRSYIDRMAEKGEENLLTKSPIERFNVSSGTTGKSKLLPGPVGSYLFLAGQFFVPYVYRLSKMKRAAFVAPLKTAHMLTVPEWRYTIHGIPIGIVSATLDKYKTESAALSSTLPLAADVHFQETGQFYLRWFFALYDSQLAGIRATFAGCLYNALDVLERNWKQLADDIRKGRLRQIHNIPVDIIEKIHAVKLIEPDPDRADEIEKECSKGFEGIIQRLWPQIAIVGCIVTGPHALHREKLQWYCGNRIRLFSAGIMASEGLVGVNMDEPGQVNGSDDQFYTLQPGSNFMEFIAADDVTKKNPETLFLDQLELGKRYEIVLTTMIGFYRYRLGDIYEVVGFRHGKTPIVRFCARVGSLLDVIGEKTSEDMIFLALSKWKGRHGLLNFTTTESVSWTKVFPSKFKVETLPFYVIFVELDSVDRELTSREVTDFDKKLCEISGPYKVSRELNYITTPKVINVRKGTFDTLKAAVLNRNKATVSNQYKTPRYVKDGDYLKQLLSAAFLDQESFL